MFVVPHCLHFNILARPAFRPDFFYMPTTRSMSDPRFEELDKIVASLSSCMERYEDSIVKMLLLEVHAHIAAKMVPPAPVTTNSAAKDSLGASSPAPTHPFMVASRESNNLQGSREQCSLKIVKLGYSFRKIFP